VKAFVALRADQQATTAEEIRLFVKERLATYKVPTSVEIVSEIPKTVSGKFLRRVLREQEIKNQTDQRPNAPAH
jgi:long-chain acyl-CoA synthetase